MKSFNTLILTVALVGLSCSAASAQFKIPKFSVPRPIKNTPFDPTNTPSFKPRESDSYLSVLVPPSMDANGNIWSGSSRADGKGKYVGKAKLAYGKSGKAYYVSNYTNSWGKVQPTQRRAPNKFDRKPSTTSRIQTPSQVNWGQPVINAYNGNVTKAKFANGRKVGTFNVGQAQLLYRNGRPYYSAFGKSVWKANSNSNTLTTTVGQSGNTVHQPGIKIGGMDRNRFNKLNNDQKLVVGITHLIGELVK